MLCVFSVPSNSVLGSDLTVSDEFFELNKCVFFKRILLVIERSVIALVFTFISLFLPASAPCSVRNEQMASAVETVKVLRHQTLTYANQNERSVRSYKDTTKSRSGLNGARCTLVEHIDKGVPVDTAEIEKIFPLTPYDAAVSFDDAYKADVFTCRVEYMAREQNLEMTQSMAMVSREGSHVCYAGGFDLKNWVWLIFLAGAAGTGCFFVASWRCIDLAKQALEWPKTTGVVMSFKIVGSSTPGGGGHRYPKIKYRYCVKNASYVSELIRTDKTDYSLSKAQIQEYRDKYHEGASVTVYYNPDDPSVAVLLPGVSRSMYGSAVLWGCFTIGCAIACILAIVNPEGFN